MKVLLITLILFFISFNYFSQLSSRHNIHYYLDSVYPKQINEFLVTYDSNENPKDTTLVYQEIFSNIERQLYEIRHDFQQGLYISDFYDTIYPFKFKFVRNPFTPASPFPKTGVSRANNTEIF